MQELTVKMFRVTVLFNPTNLESPISLVCDDFRGAPVINNGQIPVPQGLALIVLDLVTLPGGTASPAEFAEEPITWLGEGEPPPIIPKPEVFTVQRFLPYHVTILDFNTVKFEHSHDFNVNITYDGQTYQGDPTIVNQPPIDG
jgi:hypothetical protein